MSLKEISKKANVSIATVSRVLNSPDLVSEKTREKVLKIAEELKYKRLKPLAVLAKKENTIGVVIPDVLNNFYARILEGLVKKAKEYNLTVNLFLTHDSINEELKAINKIIDSNAKGMILIRTAQKYQDSLKTTLNLEKSNIPYVLIHRDLYKRNSSGIFLSNANAVYDAINLLISKSYKNIAFITGPKGNINAEERLNGYKEGLHNNNLKVNDELIVHCHFDVKHSYENTLNILDKKPDAIFCCSNQLTVGALKAIREKGLRPGKDILVFSFIKLEESNVDSQNISYIKHPIDFMGEKAVTILNNKLVGTTGLIREILDYELVLNE